MAAAELGVKKIFTGKHMTCWSMAIRPQALGGFHRIVVDDHGNIYSKLGTDAERQEREALFREPDLAKVDEDMGISPVNNFLVQKGARGAGHDCVVGPVVNRQPGIILDSGPKAGKVLVSFKYEDIYLDQNWPPPGTGWTEKPQHIHGFMTGMPMDVRTLSASDDTASLLLTGEISKDRWPSRLQITHRIDLYYGAVVRTVRVRNTGNAPAPFSFASHPDWKIPDDQPREGVELLLPADFTVAVDNELHPNLSSDPFIPVTDSGTPVAPLFNSRDKRGMFRLGEAFVDNCFTGLPKTPKFQISFPAAGYGIQVNPGLYSTLGLINAFQVFAPLWKADGAFREIALELQIGAACPFDPNWGKYKAGSPFSRHADPSFLQLLGSGMAVIKPGQEICWSIEERMIPASTR